ncbi:ABC transporter permease [Nocardioides bruguierae]|uniref:ABC transporter permease n=1 Tax=Nocardioides bruguierae TaxID=2945102 RepID=UPI002021B289|nr:ABC transporter permease [Nocardioides bruguierae]MCL8023847.1 ABC transporter permease [Nocardioides bruguierae]
MPMGRGDFLLGYALAFALAALAQSVLAVGVSTWLLGLEVPGPLWQLTLVAVVVAVLGTALGLLVSAFASTEFQAVQFMPAVVIPQLLVCGLFVPREALPGVLGAISDVLPLSYAVDAMTALTTADAVDGAFGEALADLAVVAGFAVGALALGAATLRRRTP